MFLGYAAFAIPYAWVFAALRPDDTGQPPILFSLARNGGLFAWMFLTRYGLVSSVHAFPEPGLGILFLVLLIVIWPDHPAFYRRDRAATASGRPLPSVLRPPQISKFLTWTRTAGQRS